jgi:poly(3-hydroxybutyrate) depolymerase
VHVAIPQGEPPANGWPAVVFFQGSLLSAALAFHGERGDAFGQFELAHTVSTLLGEGFAVIAPEVAGGGATFWQTNIPPASVAWEGSSDDTLMGHLFAAMDDANGPFGRLDRERLYAMGISSGGFMTSRMAVSYPGRFQALAVHSAGFAWCSAACVLPSSLPADHPPTLFAHGLGDPVVPVGVMTMYRDALRAEGIEVEAVVDEAAGHEWLSTGVTAIPAWFLAH